MNEAIVVVGVDRSGSSLCASILQEFGADLGDDLLVGDEFNERGYFESNETLGLNEAVLRTLGRFWDTLLGLQPLEELWWEAPQMSESLERIVRMLEARRNRRAGFLAFKDPRFRILLPLWQKAFSICHMASRYILTVRDPRAVSKSLSFRSGFSSHYAELYWLESYCSASNAIRDADYCIVHYEDWFETPESQAQKLWNFLGHESNVLEDFTPRLQGLIDSGLRHSDHVAEPTQLESVQRLYLTLKSGNLPAAPDIQDLCSTAQGAEAYAAVIAREGNHEPRWGALRDCVAEV